MEQEAPLKDLKVLLYLLDYTGPLSVFKDVKLEGKIS